MQETAFQEEQEEVQSPLPTVQIQIQDDDDDDEEEKAVKEMLKQRFAKYHQTHRFSLRDESSDFGKVSRKSTKFTFEDEDSEENEEQGSDLSLLKPLDESKVEDEVKRSEAQRRRKSSTIALMKLETTLSMENATSTPTTTQHIYRMQKKRELKDSSRMKKRRDTIATLT